MEKIQIEKSGDVAVLTLNNGITNAISPDLVDNFSRVLDEIRKEVKGLVLCGGKKFFSIGFDLPCLLKLNRSGMSEFWVAFNRLVFDLYTLPFGTACAMEGHAVAGGNILALTCDLRLATTDETKKIGLNEIKLGVPVPYLADLILRQLVGDRAASRMILGGEFLSMSQAESIGLIDAIHPSELLRQCALKRVQEMTDLPPRAFAEIKSNRVEEVKFRYEKNGKAKSDSFLNCWFSDSVQEMLRETSKKF